MIKNIKVRVYAPNLIVKQFSHSICLAEFSSFLATINLGSERESESVCIDKVEVTIQPHPSAKHLIEVCEKICRSFGVRVQKGFRKTNVLIFDRTYTWTEMYMTVCIYRYLNEYTHRLRDIIQFKKYLKLWRDCYYLSALFSVERGYLCNYRHGHGHDFIYPNRCTSNYLKGWKDRVPECQNFDKFYPNNRSSFVSYKYVTGDNFIGCSSLREILAKFRRSEGGATLNKIRDIRLLLLREDKS